MVWYPEGGKKQITLDSALNYFKNIIRLLIFFASWLLGFLDTDIIDLLFDSVVVDLLSGNSRKRHINMISSFLILISFGEIVSLTCERDKN